jgi:hypothetical protein
MNNSQLENGYIPKYTACPYRFECGENGGNCVHKGENHRVDFSCAFARLFDLLHQHGDSKK